MEETKAETKVGEEFKYIVRIAGTDLDGNKKVWHALSKIKGIGFRTGRIAALLAEVNPDEKLGNLSEKNIEKLDKVIANFAEYKIPPWLLDRQKSILEGKHLHLIGSDWLVSVRGDIDFMRKTRSYKGIRHELGLKVRGQRTRSTGRTGMTVGVKRKAKEGPAPPPAAAPVEKKGKIPEKKPTPAPTAPTPAEKKAEKKAEPEKKVGGQKIGGPEKT